MHYGRGGAGNIQNVEEINGQIEANLETTRSEANASGLGKLAERPEVEKRRPSDQEYVHFGRGGAGNWSSSRELSESELLASSTEPTSIRPTSVSLMSGETRYMGRGGAGNYQWNTGEKQETEQKELELRELVKRDVEAELMPPNKAHLRNGDS